MDFDDYTQPLENVIRSERKRRPDDLRVEDQIELFKKWMAANGSVVDEMERRAVEIDDSGRRVSARYLIERQRYEGVFDIVPVSFVDDYGNEHLYSFPNGLSPLFARWLKSRHPGMNIVMSKSIFDKEL